MSTNLSASWKPSALDRKQRTRVSLVLRTLLQEMKQLIAHIERVRTLVPETEQRIHSLLNGLSGDLATCSDLLQGRMTTTSQQRDLPYPDQTNSGLYLSLCAGEQLNCLEHLETLLAGYGRYARDAYDSVCRLETFGDIESAKTVHKIIPALEKGLCFIELYIEGLALHMDVNRLPEWPVSADDRKE